MLISSTQTAELATTEGPAVGVAPGIGQGVSDMIKAVLKNALVDLRGKGGSPSKRHRPNPPAPAAPQGAANGGQAGGHYERLPGGNPANPIMCARSNCSSGSKCAFNHANKIAAAAARSAQGNTPA